MARRQPSVTFILGRSIFENISLTQEMIHSINKPARGGNVVLKLDMAKAYDSVGWNLLHHVLSAFGCFEHICHLQTMYFFAMILSGNEWNSKSKASVRAIARTLEIYETWFGQKVNKDKSSIIFSKHITAARKRSLLRITGFYEETLPFKYVGVPIICGRLKLVHLDEVVGKIQERIDGWKARLLSNGARLLLIKHVLGSIPIHLLSILQVPKSVIVSLNRCFGNFFWGMKEGKPKKHWRAWDGRCKPVQEGEAGIRNIAETQKELHMKFAWKILTENSQWSRFFKAKYVK
ncbi:hypothetical protein F2P56_036732 [Juglans regia]|uniref:Uncharacterized protein n=2 Tax=Juglans regia TaxID=51240 RepID=A0A833TPG4_JUGRE|nr:uncharacterized protein LOC108995691 [Juglans regia]KAF5444244.1 hypothetical protein F2P56_036732 [Juglans regia]